VRAPVIVLRGDDLRDAVAPGWLHLPERLAHARRLELEDAGGGLAVRGASLSLSAT
jgi:hypothetical protein